MREPNVIYGNNETNEYPSADNLPATCLRVVSNKTIGQKRERQTEEAKKRERIGKKNRGKEKGNRGEIKEPGEEGKNRGEKGIEREREEGGGVKKGRKAKTNRSVPRVTGFEVVAVPSTADSRSTDLYYQRLTSVERFHWPG